MRFRYRRAVGKMPPEKVLSRRGRAEKISSKHRGRERERWTRFAVKPSTDRLVHVSTGKFHDLRQGSGADSSNTHKLCLCHLFSLSHSLFDCV